MTKSRITRSALAASGAALALLLAACGGGSGYGSSSAAGSAGSAPAVSASGNLLASAKTPLGSILVNGQAMTLYTFAADKGGRSVCDAACIAYWPPVKAPASLPASLAGVTAKLGSTTRDDGSSQLTVGGRPVYTYVGDKKPGDTNGQGTNISGGLWWVVSPAGDVVKTKAGDASSSDSDGDMSGYGSGY